MYMLTQSRINQIEASAKDVLTVLDENIEKIKAPVKVSEILKKYQIGLKIGNFEDPNISGAYDKKTKTIFVETNEPYTRQTFTIAHELGHFFLHDDKEEEFFYRSQITKISDEKSTEEQEANWFAACLLMPDTMVYKFWGLTHDLDKLSVIFAVSPTAVYYRLKNLHLVE